MIGKGATPSFFAIANYNYTLTSPLHFLNLYWILVYIYGIITNVYAQKLRVRFERNGANGFQC